MKAGVAALSRPALGEGWVAAVLIVLALAATAWARPLLLPDEGRYVGVALEMLRSGDWGVPTLDGLPFFHKPPLFYWITAASMSVFGTHAWAARAAPILGGLLGAMALYLFTRRWRDERAARLVTVALLAQPLFLLGGQFANMDMLVAGCITATILLLADAALCAERGLPHRRSVTAAYAMAALGILAKGLIGAVIPALVIVCWLGVSRRWRRLGTLVSLPGMAVMLLVAGPWFAAMQSRHDGFLDYFFVVQHFKRFASGGFNNAMPFWFYPVVLAAFSLPWLPWLPWLRRPLRPGHLRDARQGPIRLLMGVWVAAVVIFFSLPQSKLIGYVLPAVPPLAYLMADGYLALATPTRRARRLWWASATVATACSLVAVAVFSVHPRHSSRDLALALRGLRGPDEPVFMLDGYDYDVPFYAGLSEPVGVVADWTSPTALTTDNWRRELADAGRFDPVRAASVLILPASLQGRLCRSRVSWVIGPGGIARAAYPWLAQARAAFVQGGTTLWRIDAAAPGLCPAPE